ncbi:MAG: ChrR family anti-sigma-E factor [Alphaproteobacteria bacterium]|nr:ChrR family anti-sigma-E factor [Alphaproteobacteria bacterium]
MKIDHHPDESTLMSYAAGSLPEPLSAVVAAHIELCPDCAHEVRAMERIGATLFEVLAPASVGLTAGQAFAGAAPSLAATAAYVDTRPTASVLTRLLGGELADVHWKRLGFGIWHYPIKLSPNSKGDLRLIKVAPGQVMPDHGHGGSELTLILSGSYSDEFGTYRSGDLSDLGDDVEHQPVSDPVEGCVCLIASERKARFKDVLARIVQPLTGL